MLYWNKAAKKWNYLSDLNYPVSGVVIGMDMAPLHLQEESVC
jgi:hypothetical protein